MQERKATVVVDLGFGDAGKGRVVDFLSRHATKPLVVRFNGGPQAAHNVVTPDGRHHTFSQWGSGTFVGAGTFLGPRMLINPMNAFNEAEHLKSVGISDPWSSMFVSQNAIVLTPMHKALNRLRELSRGDERHGSCGEGIGEARIYGIRHSRQPLTVRSLSNTTARERLADYLAFARTEFKNMHWKGDWNAAAVGEASEAIMSPQFDDWLDAYSDYVKLVTVVPGIYDIPGYEDVIFEGAQGVLLDEHHGFHPHTTWSTTTDAWARSLSVNDHRRRWSYRTIGVVRSYMTRHGPGPFPTEDFLWTHNYPELHNGTGVWQGAWRVGALDLNLLRYAKSVCPVDYLAVTHIDRVPADGWEVCTEYRNSYGFHPSEVDSYVPVLEDFPKEGFADRIATELSVPLFMESYGPTAHETRVHERTLVEKSLPLEYAGSQ